MIIARIAQSMVADRDRPVHAGRVRIAGADRDRHPRGDAARPPREPDRRRPARPARPDAARPARLRRRDGRARGLIAVLALLDALPPWLLVLITAISSLTAILSVTGPAEPLPDDRSRSTSGSGSTRSTRTATSSRRSSGRRSRRRSSRSSVARSRSSERPSRSDWPPLAMIGIPDPPIGRRLDRSAPAGRPRRPAVRVAEPDDPRPRLLDLVAEPRRRDHDDRDPAHRPRAARLLRGARRRHRSPCRGSPECSRRSIFGRMDTRGPGVAASRLPDACRSRRPSRLLLPPAVIDGLDPVVGLLFLAAWAVIVGIANGPLDIALFTIRQRRTDPAWTGRAFAVSMAMNFVGFPIGAAIGGALADRSLGLALVPGDHRLPSLAVAFAATMVPRTDAKPGSGARPSWRRTDGRAPDVPPRPRRRVGGVRTRLGRTRLRRSRPRASSTAPTAPARWSRRRIATTATTPARLPRADRSTSTRPAARGGSRTSAAIYPARLRPDRPGRASSASCRPRASDGLFRPFAGAPFLTR